MNDSLNITATVHKDDKRFPEEKLYGKRRVKQAWPFMMPGFRHRIRPTKMHDKGERCFHLNSGNDHCYDTLKVITPAGIAKYSAHCTFGYRRQAFQGEVPTWERGLLPLRGRDRLRRFHRERHRIRWQRRHLHAAGLFPPRHRGRQQLHVGGGHSSHVFIGSGGGGGILDIFARGGCSSRVFIGTGTGGAGSSTWGVLLMSSSGAAAT